jgi:hypothetical protein
LIDTRINDSQNRGAEVLAASSSQIDIVWLH